MQVTIDANILFAALIKGGETRRVLANPELRLFAPAFIFVELLKYKLEILKKSNGSEDELNYLIALLLKNISLVDDGNLVPFIPAAQTLTNDTKDIYYFACALYKNTIIWSNDKEFKKQKRIRIFTTDEMIKETDYL
ncbi:MAG: PIN domain-containing protein [Candidatus Diapherotrites archaeon]|nr:PIN domain-containing protein [Candidatus Diapherotrites archaeon]